MLSPPSCTFKVRNDDFSMQVSCDQDSMFWFRLEIAGAQDHITDFSLGAFDPALGGDLLAMCYDRIGRIPQDQLVFDDILPSGLGSADAINNTKVNFEEYARAMLSYYGRSVRASRIVPRRGKLDLIVDG